MPKNRSNNPYDPQPDPEHTQRAQPRADKEKDKDDLPHPTATRLQEERSVRERTARRGNFIEMTRDDPHDIDRLKGPL